MKVLIIYHSRDIDGWLSGAIAKTYYAERGHGVNTIGWDYGDPPISEDKLKEAETIVIVDLELPSAIIDACTENRKELIWIDHHKSNIEKFDLMFVNSKRNNNDLVIQGLRDTEYAACELTWFYYRNNTPLPDLVRLAGLYDSFRHKGTDEEEYVLNFQFGLRSNITDISSAQYCLSLIQIDELNIDKIEQNGKLIRRYLNVIAKEDYNTKVKTTKIKGLTWGIINMCRFNPINYNIDYHKDGIDVFCCYSNTGKNWTVSLYNDNNLIDCSEIASEYGGGGHKGAAGFIMNNEQFMNFLNTNAK